MGGVPPPLSAVVRAVAAERVVVKKLGVWWRSEELALIQTANLYVPAADEGGKLSPTVLLLDFIDYSSDHLTLQVSEILKKILDGYQACVLVSWIEKKK